MNTQAILQQEAEHIYHAWDKAISNNDVDALMKLYTPDATLESPLVLHLMTTKRGICEGDKEIRRFFEEVAKHKPEIRKNYRKGFFTDGKILMWEYPRKTPEGEQMDFVEVMDIKGGLIWHHRIYWGWMGFKVMQENAYHRFHLIPY